MIGLAICAALAANPGVLSKDEVKTICDNVDSLVTAAKEKEVPPERLICVAHHESKWIPSLIGSSGECGITQVLPTKKTPCSELKKISVALEKAASLLSKNNLWHRLASSVCNKDKKCIIKHTLMGYNAGTAAALGKGSKLNRAKNYAAKIMRCERNYELPAIP